MTIRRLGCAIGISICACGCTHRGNTVAELQAQNNYYVDADEAAAAKKGQIAEDPSKIAPIGEGNNPSIASLKNKLQLAQKAYSKTPDKQAAKHDVVVATVRLATATMSDPTLDRSVKYKDALQLYWQALKLDPKNDEAKNNSELIVSIYKSLHKQVPKPEN